MKILIDSKVQKQLDELKIEYKVFACNSKYADTAAFCAEYGFEPQQSANTIIVASKTEPKVYVACLVLATSKLDVNKKVRKLLGVRKVSFATAEQTTNLTGMMIGGVTILGLPANMPVYVDSKVMEQPEIIVGGGNRTSKVIVNPQELLKLPNTQVIDDLAVIK